MKFIVFALMVAVALVTNSPAEATLSGTITDSAGAPVPGTRVFAEPGIEGAVIEGQVAADGTFTVVGDFHGSTGIVALAPGYGFGGIHLNIAAGDEPAGLRIVLGAETDISGQIADTRGTAVAEARVTSIALTHPVKVGLPLAKLGALGMGVPTSDGSGRFTVPGIPAGARVALKFEHSRYAQEAVAEVAAGTHDLRVVMHPGVAVGGTVHIRGVDTPVSNAMVAARNAQPPHDTAFGLTDGAGVFAMRLKPGVYLFQAFGAGRVSPGLQRVDITGEAPPARLRLPLSETGFIAGSIHDARTAEAIPGVRVLLETMGHAAGAARTGADGRFRLKAAEGANTLHFDSVPGYLPPDTRALRVNVPGGATLELPGLWLAPAPAFSLRVFEQDGETPVAGAFISLLRPRQFGWQTSDRDGRVALRFTALPEDNRIIGFAEHPTTRHGALFALDRFNAENASVALLPLAQVSGRVLDGRGTPVAGVTVGAMFADDALPEALPLWRCITGADGRFQWPAAPAGVPQRCVVGGDDVFAAAADINPAPGESVDIGDISLGSGVSVAPIGASDLPQLCGPPSMLENPAFTIIFHCRSTEAQVYLQAVETMQQQLLPLNVESRVAVSGAYECDEASIPVYRSNAVKAATQVVDRSGRLRLEAVGLPPIAALQQPETE